MSGGGKPAALARPARRFSPARLAAFKALESLSARLGGRRFYRATQLSAARLRCRTLELPASGPAAELAGLVICQLTDLHAGPFLGPGDLAAVVERVNGLDPDLVLLTGDYITRRAEEALGLTADLARLRPRLGSFAVFGNHDYRERREGEIEAAWGRDAGVRFLRNDGARVEVRPGRHVHLTGLEDVEEGRGCDLVAARAALAPEDVELGLVHNPLAAAEMVGSQTLAVFSGHTHGGQIDLPLVRRLAPAHPGALRRQGAAHLVCSAGLGALGVPLRVRARAEVLVARIVPAPPAKASAAKDGEVAA